MKENILIIIFFLISFSACKKQVDKDSPEFIGYWLSGSSSYGGYIFINIDKFSNTTFRIYDHENENEWDTRGKARANDKKLTIGGLTYFKIIEYPQRIDTNVEKINIYNFYDNSWSWKLATWKMVLDGLHGSINSNKNVGKRTYYMADY